MADVAGDEDEVAGKGDRGDAHIGLVEPLTFGQARASYITMGIPTEIAEYLLCYQAEYADRLQRTERLATLGQVAGGVAHELRNPLNVVKTSVYYLLNARTVTTEKQD